MVVPTLSGGPTVATRLIGGNNLEWWRHQYHGGNTFFFLIEIFLNSQFLQNTLKFNQTNFQLFSNVTPTPTNQFSTFTFSQNPKTKTLLKSLPNGPSFG
jgi:hypothetical protein